MTDLWIDSWGDDTTPIGHPGSDYEPVGPYLTVWSDSSGEHHIASQNLHVALAEWDIRYQQPTQGMFLVVIDSRNQMVWGWIWNTDMDLPYVTINTHCAAAHSDLTDDPFISLWREHREAQ